MSSSAEVRGGAPEDRNPLNALISLYNSLERANPGTGHLIVEGDLRKPSVVIFHSANPSATTSSAANHFQMKAFSLTGIPTNEWKNLQVGLESDLNTLALHQGFVEFNNPVQVILHQDTGVLVVIGPDSVLQAAESVVNAFHANHPGATPNPSQPPPEVHFGPARPATGQK